MRRFAEKYRPDPRGIKWDKLKVSESQKIVLKIFERNDPVPLTDRDIQFQLGTENYKLASLRSRVTELLKRKVLVPARQGTDKYTRRRVRRCRIHPDLLN